MGDLIFIGSLFCSLIIAYILLVKRKDYNSYSDKLLALLFISYAYCTTGYLLIKSEWILYVPHLYKTSQPINYIIPPLAYLYVRSIIFNEKKIKLVDLIHFLPSIFIAVNYIPLYISSEKNKLDIIYLVFSNIWYNYNIKDGFLPESIQFLRPFQAVIYIIFQWKLLYYFKKNYFTPFKKFQINCFLWLKKFTLLISIMVLSFLVFVFVVIYALMTHQELNDLVYYSSLPTIICLFYLSFYILVNQNVLIGLPFIELNKTELKKAIDISIYEKTAKEITFYFESQKPYLRQNLSINEVSLVLNIPLKLLSFIINQYFKQNFNDFVNGYRIAYFIEKVSKGDLEKLTLYALSQEVGFSNKTTFLAAFKKIHHCTPSQYLQNIGIHNK